MPALEPDDRVDAERPCTGAQPPATHEALRLSLLAVGREVRAAADAGVGLPAARDRLARFCFAELLAHLESDEAWLVDARFCPEGRLLAEAIRSEARTMTAAVHELAAAEIGCEAVAATRVLHALLAAHVHHEETLRTASDRMLGDGAV